MFIKSKNILNIFLFLTIFGLFSACIGGSATISDSDNLSSDGSGGEGSGGDGSGGDGSGGDGSGGDGSGGDGSGGDNAIFKPFSNDLYFGRYYINADEQKAYDLALKTMLDNYSSLVSDDGAGGRVKIDLATNGIKNIKNKNQINKIVSFIKDDEPRLFHISSSTPRPDPAGNGYTYKTDAQGNITEFYIRIHRIYLNYDKYRNEMETIEVRVSKLLDDIGDISLMNNPQIVRSVYEKYLATVSYGGMSSSYGGNIRGSFLKPNNIYYNLYQVVCEGYSRSLLYLLQRLGFLAVYIEGMTTEGLHAWNKVEINGAWYNLDSTWDDAIGYESTGSGKDNFLKSDQEFSVVHNGPQEGTNLAGDLVNTGYLMFGVRIPAALNSLTGLDYD